MIKKEVSMNKLTLEVGEEREVNFHLSYGLLSLIFARLISTHIRSFVWHFCNAEKLKHTSTGAYHCVNWSSIILVCMMDKWDTCYFLFDPWKNEPLEAIAWRHVRFIAICISCILNIAFQIWMCWIIRMKSQFVDGSADAVAARLELITTNSDIVE